MNATHKPPAASWNSHALLTRAALSSLQWSVLKKHLPVISLTEFLSKTKTELPPLIKWYWGLLSRKAKSQTLADPPWEDVKTEAGFRIMLQINPKIRLQYVRLRVPEEIHPDTPHDPTRKGPPGLLYVETPFDTAVRVFDILFTYSDEPDWGMDQDLFDLENHRYGPPPFGITNGISSQGPFHMAFFYENPLLLRILPTLTRTFLPERVRVFVALADLAFAKGLHYWGWRFTAWAIHYLQDVTAPYHARAFPPRLIPAVWGLIKGPRGRALSERIQDILKTHHVLFEAFVHLLLNEAVKKQMDHPFLSALERDENSGETGPPGSSFDQVLRPLIEASSKTASMLATRIDSSLIKIFFDPRNLRHVFRTGTEFTGISFDTLISMVETRRADFARFLDLTSTCLVITGRVTRDVVKRMQS